MNSKGFLYPLALACVILLGAVKGVAQSFQDVAQTLNVTYPYPIHAGMSFADFDGDGLDDITLGTPNTDSLLLYRNTGNGFVKIPAPVGHTSYSTTVTWVDYDNDGDKDLYITSMYIANKLYRNDSTAGFTDVTFSSGIYSSPTPSFGCSWGDYNNDGWLDLHQCNRTAASPNFLYLSNGNGGFTEVALNAGVGSSKRLSFSSAFLDINKNGLQDLFIANDRMQQSMLYKNNGDSTFSDISALAGADIIIDGMSTTVGDYNNDGYLDIYVTNTYGGNKLLHNNQNETFTEVSDSLGVAFNSFCWSASFIDYDNDGDQDLYVSELYDDTISGSGNCLFQNSGGSFTQLANQLPGDTTQSYCSTIGDFNNDGYYDIVSPNFWPHGLQLWENQESSNNWVKVLLEGTRSNRDGIGSWIRVYAGQDTYFRYTICGDGYLTQESFTKIIGLGTHNLIDSLKVKWLSGHEDIFYNLPVNQLYHITEGESYKAALNVSGELMYCLGDSISLNLATAKPHQAYLWSTGDTAASLRVTAPGMYYVKTINSTGFEVYSDTLSVLIDSLSVQVSVKHDSLNQSVGEAQALVIGGIPPFTFHWNDPNLQTGALATNLSSGTYKVLVSDSVACQDSAVVEILNPLGHAENPLGCGLYPNPVRAGQVMLLEAPLPSAGRLQIFNAQGVLQAEQILAKSKEYQITTAGLAPGVYYLRANLASKEFYGKILIVE